MSMDNRAIYEQISEIISVWAQSLAEPENGLTYPQAIQLAGQKMREYLYQIVQQESGEALLDNFHTIEVTTDQETLCDSFRFNTESDREYALQQLEGWLKEVGADGEFVIYRGIRHVYPDGQHLIDDLNARYHIT